MSYTRESFYRVCKDAEAPKRLYLSLYRVEPFYGGPEEGGWYGQDVVLEASQEFASEEARNAALEAVNALCERLNAEAQRSYGEQCLRECEWLEERGLDDDFLPEPDGPTRYRVFLESVQGSHESEGCRHYE